MTRRRVALVLGSGCLTTLAAPVLVVLWWLQANRIPSYPLPEVRLPEPNALADYVAAATAARDNRHQENLAAAAAGRPSGYTLAYAADVPTEQVRAVVTRNHAALRRLRTGFAREYQCPRYHAWSRDRPRWLSFWDVARALRAEGELAEREGRLDEAAHSYLDCLRLGADLPHGGGDLSAARMGIAVQTVGLDGLSEIALRLDGDTAARVLSRMRAIRESETSLPDVLTQERDAATANLLIALRHPPSRGSLYVDWDHRDFEGWLRFSFTPKKVLLDRFRGYMDRWTEISRDKYYTPIEVPRRPYDPVSRRGIPNLPRALFNWAKRDAWWLGLQTLLAARTYQARTGRLPPDLDALTPHLLPTIPEDPFFPAPLAYRLVQGRPVVYSRGPDTDDDLGRDSNDRIDHDSDTDLRADRTLPL